ncbi:hypothetical protein SAMN06269173_103507 [Hymenobacter mucosus]|uniref:Uncharacterized protein n=2 Tax=Hymenobacter mucosus TaxID=1411120 RepID=A0A238X8I4_9BACT|nr:hypothetical protein SAMN06269173_103507 [Hymenobacter mucosus]
MSMSYPLEKWVWTENDFEQMSWHDARIYAVQFGKDISFDIDYIFEWIQLDKDDFFSFVVAPATLVFPEPSFVSMDIDIRLSKEIEIEDISRRVSATGETKWHIQTHQGNIVITAPAFRQIVRRAPTQQTGQQVLPEERGLPSFSTVPDPSSVESAEVREIKAADFALRQKAASLRRLRRQLEALLEQRNAGVLEVKQYLQEKRLLEARISQLKIELEETGWQGNY